MYQEKKMGNFQKKIYPSFFFKIGYYNGVIYIRREEITFMLIDQREKMLETTKHYNNSYNYLLSVYPELRRGKTQLNRKKLQKKVFPNEEDYSSNHNEESVKKFLNKKDNSLTADEYSSFVALFDYEPMILFKNIDEINDFEQSIMKECFFKIKYCIHDICRPNKNIDVLTLKRALMKDRNYFYFEPVRAAIEFARLFCTDLLSLENTFSEKDFDLVCLNQYLDVVFNFLEENMFPLLKTFGKYSFNYIRNHDDTKAEDYVNQVLIGLDDGSRKTILEKLKSKNGESTKLVLKDGTLSYDESIEKSEEDIRRAILVENSGMYLTRYMGRYRRYQELSLYSNKLNKGAEIVAVNNWIDLFSYMKKQILLHSAAFEDQNQKNDRLGENCDSLLSHISAYKLECCNFFTSYDRQREFLNMIDNIGSAVLPAILQEYIKMVNNSVNYELFIGELL